MTDAQVSQVATEVLRTNLAVTADVSQLAVEVLISNLSNGVGSASGTASSSFVGDSAGIVQDRTVSTGGTATVSGIIQAIIDADFSSSGLTAVSGDGLAVRQAVASATGASSETWVGSGAGLSIALSTGLSDASAVGGVAASFASAGSSVSEAVTRFLHSAATQIGDGVSCDDDTQDATGNIGNTGVGITTQIPGTFACGTLTGGFTPGPSGSYTRASICSETAYHCEESYTPTMPSDIIHTWKKTEKLARCCDVSWSGNEIIIGTYQEQHIVDGNLSPLDGYVYVSRDKGASWIRQSPYSDWWQAVTMTANASLLGAYQHNNAIHYISNDGGAGWSPVGHPWGTVNLVDVKICDLGNNAMAGKYPGSVIYLSSNNGGLWSPVVPGSPPVGNPTFTIGDMSSDGKICYAGHAYPSSTLGKMYQSKNSGASWVELDAYCAWGDIACSGDGKYVLGTGASFYGDGLTWFSSDFGVTFRKIPVVGVKAAMSTNGRVQAYVSNTVLYVSSDYGLTFNSVPELTSKNVTDIAINADGSVVVACCQFNYVYIGTA